MDPRLGLVEPLGRLFFLGRSSRHRPDRAAVIRRAEFEKDLKKLGSSKSPASRAARGRLLRLLGRLPEARRELDAAAKAGSAAAFAFRWELSCAEGKPRHEDLDEARRLEPESPFWLCWDAVRAAEGSRREDAVDLARKAAALLPKDALPRFVEGLAWLADGRAAEAEAALTRGLVLEPAEWAYRARALARHDQGKKDACLEDCYEAMRRSEMIGTLFIPLGLARRQVSIRENISAATRELDKDPKAWWALVYRSDYRREPSVNENAGAVEDLRRALALDPKRAFAWAYLARCQTAAGDFKGAKQSLETAAKLDPKCGWIRAWLGEHARRAGKPKEALADLEKALALEPDYELAYAWRGGAKRALGKNKEALADLDAAISLDPTYVEWCFFERMAARRDAGRVGDALEDLEQAHRLNPKFVWENDPKRFAKALKDLAKVKDSRRGRALAWRAEILLRMRDFPAAEKEAGKAIAADPGLALAPLLRGRARGELGRWDDAMKDFDAAAERSGGSGVALAWRGRAKLMRGDVRGARADLRAALTSRTEKAAAWIHAWKAEAELAAGDAAAAERSASDALELHPRYAEARLWRGLARAGHDDAGSLEDLRAAAAGDLTEQSRAKLDAALAEAERLEKAAPAALAARLAREGRHAEAAAAWGEELAAHPGDPAALAGRAEAYRCSGEYAKMVADLETLAKGKPADAGALTQLGDARRHALDFHGALEDARAAIALDRSSSFARVLEAECLRSLGEFPEAISAAGRAVDAAPEWTWALVVRAKARRFAGDLAGAEADARRALSVRAEHYGYGWRAEIRRKAGRLEEALSDATKAVELQPQIAWLRAVRGETLRALGRLDEGWAEMRRAVSVDANCSCAFDFLGAEIDSVKKDPSLAWVYAWRGGVARAKGDLASARADLERAHALDPKAGWIAAWLGELDLQEGRAADAVARLDLALTLHPGLREARVWRGRAAFALGDTSSARADFEAALAADANDPWALIGAAACHEKDGKARKAAELFARAKALAPALFAEES